MNLFNRLGKVATNVGKATKKAVRDTGAELKRSDVAKGVAIAAAVAVTGGLAGGAVVSGLKAFGPKLLAKRSSASPEPLALLPDGGERDNPFTQKRIMLNANRDKRMENAGGGAAAVRAEAGAGDVKLMDAAPQGKAWLPWLLIVLVALAVWFMSRKKGE